MSRPQPSEYRPRHPVTAMKVEKPYAAVTEWCRGRLLTRYGKGSTVTGIEVPGPYDQFLVAQVGDYVASDPIMEGYFTVYPGDDFERYFTKVEK